MRLLAFALLLTGCLLPDRTPTYTLHGDPMCPMVIQDGTALATGQWNYQTKGIVDIDIQWDLSNKHVLANKLKCVHSTDEDVVEREKRTGRLLGWTNGIDTSEKYGRPIVINIVHDRIQTSHIANLTVQHEIGHTLGIDHGPGHTFTPTHMMYPAIYGQRTPCLKYADLNAFCAKNNCRGWSDLPGCPDQDLSIFTNSFTEKFITEGL